MVRKTGQATLNSAITRGVFHCTKLGAIVDLAPCMKQSHKNRWLLDKTPGYDWKAN